MLEAFRRAMRRHDEADREGTGQASMMQQTKVLSPVATLAPARPPLRMLEFDISVR